MLGLLLGEIDVGSMIFFQMEYPYQIRSRVCCFHVLVFDNGLKKTEFESEAETRLLKRLQVPDVILKLLSIDFDAVGAQRENHP